MSQALGGEGNPVPGARGKLGQDGSAVLRTRHETPVTFVCQESGFQGVCLWFAHLCGMRKKREAQLGSSGFTRGAQAALRW